jgi:hypothetical protein
MNNLLIAFQYNYIYFASDPFLLYPRLISLISYIWAECLFLDLGAFIYNVDSPKCLVHIYTWCKSLSPLLEEDLLPTITLQSLVKAKNNMGGKYRIGPHSIEIISIIFGSMLGNSYGECIKGGVGTRFTFQQESRHVSYLL